MEGTEIGVSISNIPSVGVNTAVANLTRGEDKPLIPNTLMVINDARHKNKKPAMTA